MSKNVLVKEEPALTTTYERISSWVIPALTGTNVPEVIARELCAFSDFNGKEVARGLKFAIQNACNNFSLLPLDIFKNLIRALHLLSKNNERCSIRILLKTLTSMQSFFKEHLGHHFDPYQYIYGIHPVFARDFLNCVIQRPFIPSHRFRKHIAHAFYEAHNNRRFDDCFTLALSWPFLVNSENNDPILKDVFQNIATPSLSNKCASLKIPKLQKLFVDTLIERNENTLANRYTRKFGLNTEAHVETLNSWEASVAKVFIHKLGAVKAIQFFFDDERFLHHTAMHLLNRYRKTGNAPHLVELCYLLYCSNPNPRLIVPESTREEIAQLLASNPEASIQAAEFVSNENHQTFPLKTTNEYVNSSTFLQEDCITLEDVRYTLSNVFWLTTKKKIKDALIVLKRNVLTNNSFIALDAEWRPFPRKKYHAAALLQIAYDDRILLIDLLTLSDEAHEQVANLFADPDIIKIGFTFRENDWGNIVRRSPSIYKKLTNYFELVSVLKFIAESSNSKNGILQHYLKPSQQLKGYQISNWEKRPLPLGAAIYAALDVAVIVRMVQKVIGIAGTSNIKDIINIQHNKSNDEKTTNNSTIPIVREASPVLMTTLKNEFCENSDPELLDLLNSSITFCNEKQQMDNDIKRFEEWKITRETKEWAFLVVPSLTKVARRLRVIGVDVEIATITSSYSLTELAILKNRIILHPYVRQRPNYGSALVYWLSTNDANEQFKETFKIAYAPDDICSRCSECNARSWVKVTKEHVKGLISEKTVETYDDFFICAGCAKIFWNGRMWERARNYYMSFKSNTDEREALRKS